MTTPITPMRIAMARHCNWSRRGGRLHSAAMSRNFPASRGPDRRFASSGRSAIDWKSLYQAADEARRKAHAPYSKFAVGVAVLGADGSISKGCNVENASYGLT